MSLGAGTAPKIKTTNPPVFQVLRLLEMLGLPELVIELATLAIMESADDWRSQVQPLLSQQAVSSGTSSTGISCWVYN